MDVDELIPHLVSNFTLDDYRMGEVRERQGSIKQAQYLMEHVILRGTRTTLNKLESALIESKEDFLATILQKILRH